jgi:hypothetical protein
MATEKRKELNKILKASEISIHIDHYDDIFSDFDSRHYSIRALSDDFLMEVKKASKVKPSGDLELHFIIPKNMQNGEHEALIRKRLRDYFKKHGEIIKKEIVNTRKKGLIFILVGVICSMSAAYLSTAKWLDLSNPSVNFIFNLAFTLLEPAGWFNIWTGFERLVSTREEKRDELLFHERMARAEVHFTSY